MLLGSGQRLVALVGLLVASSVWAEPNQSPVAASITPEIARSLYDQIAPLREADGCRLTRFDTNKHYIDAQLATAAGALHSLRISVAADFLFGAWETSAAGDAALACSETVAAIERVLARSDPPSTLVVGARWERLRGQYGVLAVSFAALASLSVWLVFRAMREHRPPLGCVGAILGLTAIALALRAFHSPHTFLHEYFHIAETITGYLEGNIAPLYGLTGPSLFRLTSALLDQRLSIGAIFWTNAFLATLAIPLVGVLALQFTARWSHALGSGALLCVLPIHLRFSASEVLFVPAVTFGLWALVLAVHFVRSQYLAAGLGAALALSLAVQSRPEMIVFPGVVLACVLAVDPSGWRRLLSAKSLLFAAVLVVLLIPRLLELWPELGTQPPPRLRELSHYFDSTALLNRVTTPRIYLFLVAIGSVWAMLRRPTMLAWVVLVFVGFTVPAFSMHSNPPYNLRSQFLPMAFTVLLGGAAMNAWIDLSGAVRRRIVIGASAFALAVLSIAFQSREFVGKLFDQQLEFAFLDRSIAELPDGVTLLAAAHSGGHRLNAFPDALLRRDGKSPKLVDIHEVAEGNRDWPAAGEQLIYYQGMYCYFGLGDDPAPDPMTSTCQAVHDRYDARPLLTEELQAEGYSWLRYARGGRGPYLVGFYRLLPRL